MLSLPPRPVAAVALSSLAFGLAFGCSAGSGATPTPSPDSEVPEAKAASAAWELGGFHHPVRTEVPEAQLWFDRGLALTYGFNHEESIQCFRKAQEADPSCAMAYWGQAYAAGPNYNDPAMDAAETEFAREGLEAATRLRAKALPVERSLIEALAARYGDGDRAELDRAYADAMRDVAGQYPEDPAVLALFAEALMNLRPWALWNDDGSPAPGTEEIRTTLERGLELAPEHPALCHLYIHAMEASPNPGVAAAAADRLRHRIPCSGHLVHMPSHIDIQIGRYHEAVLANQRGIAADLVTCERTGRENNYSFYRIHNYHFLAYAAMFDGQSEVALDAARELAREIPPNMLAQIPDMLDSFVGTALHVLVRFGRWDEILAEPRPDAELCVTTATWHYARGIALAATGRVDEATAEQRDFERVRATVPPTRTQFQNSCLDILAVASAMLDGEIAYRRGDFETAFGRLREAVRLDDGLKYDEPWAWMQPVRHALGALLLEQGRVAEAQEVYEADLERHPRNGWAMHGLAECLRRSGDQSAAEALEREIESVWTRADVPLRASCLCRTVGG